jgi:predicted permease
MLNYGHLVGGLISSEIPYLILILFGIFFAKQGIFHKEGTISFAKLMKDIFIPIYIFIQIARSTSLQSFQNANLIIISLLCQILIAGLISVIYLKITKMEVRYQYSWLFLNCFVDHKEVHRLMNNTFCSHMNDLRAPAEEDFCKNLLSYNFVQVFFQSLIIWYLAYNLVRADRKAQINYEKIVGGKIEGLRVETNEGDMKINTEKGKVAQKDNNENKNENPTIIPEEKNKWWREMIYILFRPPLIACFTGFVVGFIPAIQTWIFTTTTAVYVRNN